MARLRGLICLCIAALFASYSAASTGEKLLRDYLELKCLDRQHARVFGYPDAFLGNEAKFACNLVDTVDHRIRWRKAYHRIVEVPLAPSASAAGDTLGIFLETFDPRLLQTIISSDPSIFPEEHKKQFNALFFDQFFSSDDPSLSRTFRDVSTWQEFENWASFLVDFSRDASQQNLRLAVSLFSHQLNEKFDLDDAFLVYQIPRDLGKWILSLFHMTRDENLAKIVPLLVVLEFEQYEILEFVLTQDWKEFGAESYWDFFKKNDRRAAFLGIEHAQRVRDGELIFSPVARYVETFRDASLNTEELALLRKFYPDSLTWELVAANPSELESRSDALIREGKLVLEAMDSVDSILVRERILRIVFNTEDRYELNEKIWETFQNQYLFHNPLLLYRAEAFRNIDHRSRVVTKEILTEFLGQCDELSSRWCDRSMRFGEETSSDNHRVQADFSSPSIDWRESTGCKFVQGWEAIATRQIKAGSLPSMLRNGCLPKDLLLGQEDGIDPWDVLKNTLPYPDRYLVLNNSYLVLDQLRLASSHLLRFKPSDSGLIAPFVPDVLEDWHTGVVKNFVDLLTTRYLTDRGRDNFREQPEDIGRLFSLIQRPEVALFLRKEQLDKALSKREPDYSWATYRDLAEVKRLSRDLLIPDWQIIEAIEEYLSRLQSLKFDDDLSSPGFGESRNSLKNIYSKNSVFNQSYLKGARQDEIVEAFTSAGSSEAIATAFGLLFGASQSEVSSICRDQSFVRGWNSVKKQNSQEFNYWLNYNWARDDYLRFWSSCAETLDFKGDPAVDSLVNGFLSGILRSGMPFTHPNMLRMHKLLVESGIESKNIFVARAGFEGIRSIYQTAVELYLNNGSIIQRSMQPLLEDTLIALIRFSDFLGQSEPENRLIEEIDQFVKSARLVVLSDKTVERQIDGIDLSYIDSSLWIDRYFKPRFSRIRSAAAEAENVIGYFANSGHLLPREHDWISYNLSEMPVMRSTQKFLDGTYNQSIELVSVMASSNEIAIYLTSKDEVLHFSLQDEFIPHWRTQFSAADSLTLNTLERACQEFRFIHEQIPQGHKIVVPSLNLAPIPMSVVLGSACLPEAEAIIHVGSFQAGIELLERVDKPYVVNTFFGVGDPGESSNDLLIALETGTRAGSQKFQFARLPDAAIEVEEVASIFSSRNITTGESANLREIFRRVSDESKSSVNVMLLATHGVPVSANYGSTFPGLLSVDESGQLDFVYSNEVARYDFSNGLVSLSACDTASGLSGRPDSVYTGFVQEFALSGADFVMSSMWPLKSQSAKSYSIQFFDKLNAEASIVGGLMAGRDSIAIIDQLPIVLMYP